MVQEQLALHQVEWEVVECPSQHRSANFVVKALEDRVVVVFESSLPSQNSKALENSKDRDSQGRAPPDDRVTN